MTENRLFYLQMLPDLDIFEQSIDYFILKLFIFQVDRRITNRFNCLPEVDENKGKILVYLNDVFMIEFTRVNKCNFQVKGFFRHFFRLTAVMVLLFFVVNSASAQIVQGDGCRFLGNVIGGSVPSNFTDYWNQVTPENAGKWGSVEGTRDNMNWSGLDNAYNLAKDNGFTFKQHVFIWGNQQPSWIEDLPEEEQFDEIEEWITAFCDRYPETDIIEVVNEPLNDPPNEPGNGGGNYFDALGGTGDTGWDWIVNAFQLARDHCPNAKLMINEYNILNNSGNLSVYTNIVNILKDLELIDAVGVQAHYFTINNASIEQIESSLDQLAELELPVYITELEIEEEDDQVQLQQYQEIFPVIWEHSGVEGVTLWGYIQNQIWRPDGYLVRATGTKRPAMTWLEGYVNQQNARCLVTGNKHEGAGIIKTFYPNPASADGIFNVISTDNIVSLELRDAQGRVIGNYLPDHPKNEMEIKIPRRVPTGVYFLVLENRSGRTYEKLLIR